MVRATSTVRRFLSGTHGHNGFDGAGAKLLGQDFVTRVAVVSVVTNDFCHVHIIWVRHNHASVFAKIQHMGLNSIDVITYSQYYSQFVKDHEKELSVLVTSHPKDHDADVEVAVAAE